MERLYELVPLTRLDQLYALKDTLERCGVCADILGADNGGLRRPFASHRYSRLMVLDRDVVYAPWVEANPSLDPWAPVEQRVSARSSAGLPASPR